MNVNFGNIPARPRSKRLIRNINEVRKSGGSLSFDGGTQFKFSPSEVILSYTGEIKESATLLYTSNGFSITDNISTDVDTAVILWDETGENVEDFITISWVQSGAFYSFDVMSTLNPAGLREKVIYFTENGTDIVAELLVTQSGRAMVELTSYTQGSGSITSITPAPATGNQYVIGTQVTLTANNGNTSNDSFSRWIVTGSVIDVYYTQSITINMSEDKTAVAYFDTDVPDVIVFELSPTSMSFNSSGGTKLCTITSTVNGNNQSWSASVNSAYSWITVSPPSGGGAGTLLISVGAYTPSNGRSGYVNVSNGYQTKSLFVQQTGETITYTLTTDVSSVSLPSGASDNNRISVTASTRNGVNYAWSASSNQGWCSISPGYSSGTGGGIIVFSASANTGTSARTATITISQPGGAVKTVTISQPAPNIYPNRALAFSYSPNAGASFDEADVGYVSVSVDGAVKASGSFNAKYGYSHTYDLNGVPADGTAKNVSVTIQGLTAVFAPFIPGSSGGGSGSPSVSGSFRYYTVTWSASTASSFQKSFTGYSA